MYVQVHLVTLCVLQILNGTHESQRSRGQVEISKNICERGGGL